MKRLIIALALLMPVTSFAANVTFGEILTEGKILSAQLINDNQHSILAKYDDTIWQCIVVSAFVHCAELEGLEFSVKKTGKK